MFEKPTENVKECSRCKRLHPLDGFYTKGNRRDSSCKSCVKQIKAKKYRESKRRKVGVGRSELALSKMTWVQSVYEGPDLEPLSEAVPIIEQILRRAIVRYATESGRRSEGSDNA